MTEIKKMYRNAGVKFIIGVHCRAKIGDGCKSRCPDCDYNTKPKDYPPFTAEKQLALFQWICKKFEEIYISYTDFEEVKSWEIVYKISVHRNSFEECLCAFINLFWQDLTEQERTEIKQILEN